MPLLLLGVATSAQGQAGTEAGVQVLTRGPVHEAFAEASMAGATVGIVVTKSPYDPITELPPDQRPEGANVAWIPGYWSWDDDRTDYIWVSGVWRDLPPGRQWVPGYWASVEGGSQWISGFWGETARTEVTYLPPPPEPLEAGPNSPLPGPGNIWTPGCWVWQTTRYAWQPGYWVAQHPNWIWVSAHYTWTPRGYVYVPGYWDHDIVHRGVMFAPVYYERPIYARPDYYYSPATVIDLAMMAACLFIQPRSRHYYYGDYYDRRYEERGFFPWYSRQVSRYGDDPIYTHYRSRQLERDPDWDIHVDEQYRYRREHVEARPPQTLALQVNIINTQVAGAPENLIIGKSLTEAAQSTTLPLRLAPVNMEERKQIQTRGREVNQFQLERKRLETAHAASGKSAEITEPVKLQLPESPVAAKPLDKVEKGNAPPPMPAAPEPETEEGKGKQETPPAESAEPVKSAPAPAKPESTPKKTEAKPEQAQEKPKQVESAPAPAKPESTPKKTEAKPEQAQDKPKQVESAPAPAKPESTPKKTEAKPEQAQDKPKQVESAPAPAKPESTPKKTEAKPEQAQEKPKQVESAPAPAKPKTHKVQSVPQTAEPEHKATKPTARSQNPEPNAQPPRSETSKQKGDREQAPNPQDKKNKNKKNEKK